ncbi:MAG: helix-turn-helix domain-containing protein, partial [Rhodospirillaceae bacterium]|nr:helix-turn-helix domain-containing protein [Rhodospirillaceae bacterium]
VLIMRLRRKMESDPKNPRYLQTIRGKGYTLMPD